MDTIVAWHVVVFEPTLAVLYLSANKHVQSHSDTHTGTSTTT